MAQRQSAGEQSPPQSGDSQPRETPGLPEKFNGAKLWIGRHAADADILVFDPAEPSPSADRISLYSLTQHRKRTFPRAVVDKQIRGVTDEVTWRRAIQEYENRSARRQAHEDTAATAKLERVEQQQQGVIQAHRAYLAAIGIGYQGVVPTPANHRSRRRSKCHACGIGLDDFAGAVCMVCNGVLCSCGACACVRDAGPMPVVNSAQPQDAAAR